MRLNNQRHLVIICNPLGDAADSAFRGLLDFHLADVDVAQNNFATPFGIQER
jgi:hypothetical protein